MDIDNLKDLILSELKERNLVDVTEEIEWEEETLNLQNKRVHTFYNWIIEQY